MSLLLLLNNNQPAASEILAAAELRDRIQADAYDWTGIESRARLDTEGYEKTKTLILELRIQLEKSNLTNVERARAHSIVTALSALIESPEPEWRAIVRLFSSPSLNNVMSIANILVILYQTMGLS